MPLGVFLVNPSLDLVGINVFLKLDKKKKSPSIWSQDTTQNHNFYVRQVPWLRWKVIFSVST